MNASMTGYGKAENKNKNFSINVEIKSVNNRFFEPILKLPHSIKDYEQIITNFRGYAIALCHIFSICYH